MSDFTEKPSASSGPSDLPPPQITLPPSHARGSLLITILAASIVAALVAVVLTLGIQAFQGNLVRANTLTQQGKVALGSEEPVQVFYPVPYVSPPNLTLTNGAWVVIVEQKPDSFKLRKVPNSSTVEVGWKAEGVPQK